MRWRARYGVSRATSCILPIPNEKQVADGLCWAAALVPIVTYITGRTLSQHDLCAAAGRRPSDGATTTDMASALRRAARIRTYPTSPIAAAAILAHLKSHRPMVLVLNVGQGFCHCVCLRGIVHDGEWQAVVNEPNLASHTSVYAAFARVRAAWCEGLVIAGRS